MNVSGKFPGWLVGTCAVHQGDGWWASGHMVDRGVPGMGVEPEDFDLYGPAWSEGHDSSIPRFFESACRVSCEGLRAENFGLSLVSSSCLARAETGHCLALHAPYVAYFKRKYPGCSFYLPPRAYREKRGANLMDVVVNDSTITGTRRNLGKDYLVAVVFLGDLVGVLMPQTKMSNPVDVWVEASAPLGPPRRAPFSYYDISGC